MLALIPFKLRFALVASLGMAALGVGWKVYDSLSDGRVTRAVEKVTTKGAADADKVIKGEHDVYACRDAGGVWNLARGRCEQ